MRLMLLIVGVLLIAVSICSVDAIAGMDYEKYYTFTDIDEGRLIWYTNYTGDDAEYKRYYIDRYYDDDGYPGDGEVTQDEVDDYIDDLEDNYDDNDYSLSVYLDGVRAEIDSCDITISGVLGDTDSSKKIEFKYVFEISFDDIDPKSTIHIMTRDTTYYDIDIVAVTVPPQARIVTYYGLDDASLRASDRRYLVGEQEEDDQVCVVITYDRDNDGHLDANDAFPDDPSDWKDSDGDGYGDNRDLFPTNKNDWNDTDGDGYGDNDDIFPYNPHEVKDSDQDGVGDNTDAFPTDPAASVDSDLDGFPDRFNDGFYEDQTELQLDYQPHNASHFKKVEKEVHNPLFVVLSSILGVICLILIVAVVVLVLLLQKKGKKTKEQPPPTPPSAQRAPPPQYKGYDQRPQQQGGYPPQQGYGQGGYYQGQQGHQQSMPPQQNDRLPSQQQYQY